MSGILAQAGAVAFQLAFQASPIILVGGIASGFGIDGMLPIIALTDAVSVVNGLFFGNFPTSLDQLFAQFIPLPGSTLISQQIGMYPFANQQVAANAIIVQPKAISLLMRAPVSQAGGYVAKLATFTALQAALSQHNTSGGTYTICTPAFIYDNCVMIGMQDVTAGDGKQPQVDWQLDFVQPLITTQAATQAYNSQMQQMASGLPPASGPSAPTTIYGTNINAPLFSSPGSSVVPVTSAALAAPT